MVRPMFRELKVCAVTVAQLALYLRPLVAVAEILTHRWTALEDMVGASLRLLSHSPNPKAWV